MKRLKLNKKLAGAVAALALLAGCETATPYQPLGTPGASGGFTDQQLDATHFRVNFFGNSMTSRQQVENYLLYRAAELTLAHGDTCFTIVNHNTNRQSTYEVDSFGPDGGGLYPWWSPFWRFHGPWGWYSYDPWLGGPFFPQQYDINRIDRYEATADIAVSRGSCTTNAGTFNAAQVAQNLRPYIVYPRPR